MPAIWGTRLRGTLALAVVRESLGAGSLKKTVRNVSEYLVAHDYTGPEISPAHAPERLSTTLAAALSGWLALAEVEPGALAEATRCIDAIVRQQSSSGAWLFPYPFRDNGPQHPYACEMLMTLSGLLDAAETNAGGQAVQSSLQRGIRFLLEEIGWSEDGALWYSATDHIGVPNIASMAASVFARGARVLHEPSLQADALRAFDYCVRTQAADGAYPYFAGEPLVYVPYHALQLWHMCLASRSLGGEVHSSIRDGMRWLDRFLRQCGYCPTNEKASPWIAKTPLWIAMANLQYGRREVALRHYLAARHLFWDQRRDVFFYTLDVQPRVRRRLDTVYPRYVASSFEIGAALLARGRSTSCP